MTTDSSPRFLRDKIGLVLKVVSASNAANANNNGNANNNTASNANYVAAINFGRPACRCWQSPNDKENQSFRYQSGK